MITHNTCGYLLRKKYCPIDLKKKVPQILSLSLLLLRHITTKLTEEDDRKLWTAQLGRIEEETDDSPPSARSDLLSLSISVSPSLTLFWIWRRFDRGKPTAELLFLGGGDGEDRGRGRQRWRYRSDGGLFVRDACESSHKLWFSVYSSRWEGASVYVNIFDPFVDAVAV